MSKLYSLLINSKYLITNYGGRAFCSFGFSKPSKPNQFLLTHHTVATKGEKKFIFSHVTKLQKSTGNAHKISPNLKFLNTLCWVKYKLN